MKSALAGLLVTGALLAMDVVRPPAQFGYASETDRAFEERHSGESREAIRNELGLDRR
jgi:hypothetical protein